VVIAPGRGRDGGGGGAASADDESAGATASAATDADATGSRVATGRGAEGIAVTALAVVPALALPIAAASPCFALTANTAPTTSAQSRTPPAAMPTNNPARDLGNPAAPPNVCAMGAPVVTCGAGVWP
jgi:hypothetical protein